MLRAENSVVRIFGSKPRQETSGCVLVAARLGSTRCSGKASRGDFTHPKSHHIPAPSRTIRDRDPPATAIQQRSPRALNDTLTPDLSIDC